MNHRFNYVAVVDQNAGVIDWLPVQHEVNSFDAYQGK